MDSSSLKKSLLILFAILVLALVTLIFFARSDWNYDSGGVATQGWESDGVLVNIPSIDDLEIEISHSVCRGDCPAYSVEIYGTGEIIFEGKYSTSTIGTVKDRLGQPEMTAVATEIYKSGYFDPEKISFCDDSLVADAQFTFVRIRWQGLERITKPCEDHSSEPLRELTRRIEFIANTTRWIDSGT